MKLIVKFFQTGGRAMRKEAFSIIGTIFLAVGFVALRPYTTRTEFRAVDLNEVEKKREFFSLIESRMALDEKELLQAYEEVFEFDEKLEGNLNILGNGGPDAFGYFFTHVPFGFENLADGTVDPTVTEVELGDDASFLLTLPFSFPFYDKRLDTVRVSSNGYLTAPDQIGNAFINRSIPNVTIPDNLIALFWDDLWGLGGPAGREIRYTHRTGGRVDSTIVQYNDWGFFVDFGRKRNTFQVILESTGHITFNYMNVDSTLPFGPHSATAGIENSDASIGLQVAFNQFDGNGHIKDNTSIRITPPITIIPVEFDIKPQSCPNPLNTKSNGVLPVAILGSETFDVTDIIVSSVRLEGVEPIRSAMEDNTQPVRDRQTECQCTTDAGDGFTDLTLKFDKQEIVAALGSVNDGDSVVLVITGELENGDFLEGQDCVVIRKKGDNRKGGDGSLILDAFTPLSFTLAQNEPNPVKNRTTILYSIEERGHVSLLLYDLSGRLVRTLVNGYEQAGVHSSNWDGMDDAGRELTNGVYFYRLVSGDFSTTRKLVVLR
jgi:hypothetical protein